MNLFLHKFRTYDSITVEVVVMPTKMPRVTFAISEDELSKVEAFQRENNIKNQSQAFIQLIRMGFNDIEQEPTVAHTMQKRQIDSPVDRLTAIVNQLTPEQACFMVKLVENLLQLNPDAYAAACKESENLWKG